MEMIEESQEWFVMLHGNPQLIDFQLRREKGLRQLRRESIDYFIPFSFLSRIVDAAGKYPEEEVSEVNCLRQDFHDFVFVRTTRSSLESLLRSTWNRSMHHRLRHYRDYSHRVVTLSDEEMKHLINIFSERRIKFSIGLPTPDVYVGEMVHITQEGAFCGHRAKVIGVKHTAEGISLTLGISVFADTKELKLKGIKLSAIRSDRSTGDIIDDRFLNDAESALTDILSRRVYHKETDESNRQDAITLNNIFIYSYLVINDAAMAARFLALMLVCASLRYDKGSTDALSDRARVLLDSDTPLPADIQAYLNFALYVATLHPDYRDAGKQCVQAHPELATDSLRHLMSIVKNIRIRRKPKMGQ